MIPCMILATVFFLVFTILIISANDGITDALLQCLKEQEQEKIKSSQITIGLIVDEMKRTQDLNNKKAIQKARKCKKDMDTAQKRLEMLEKGKIEIFDMIPLAGYRLIQLLKWDYSNNTVKKLNQKCTQFKEKKEAMNYTFFLLASLFAYTILAISMFFLFVSIGLSMQLGTRAIVIAIIAFVIFFIIGYVPYDNVNVIVRKRAEEIEKEFPQMVSKLALLTVAGMEVNQAWKLAGQGGNGVIYEEMNRVLIDLEHNVAPPIAYGKFISRCSNKYTTKLATAIIQNMSKGNSEIVKLFRTLNDESWLEHKHNARRMGEKIQSKLMIPTLLMFLGIIILVIVPVISGFNM